MAAATTLKHRYGPWAIVTGASDGIGRAFATQLAEAKFNLVLVARRRALLDELSAELQRENGIECDVFDIDLARADAVATLISSTTHHNVGLLVAAAGFGTSGPFLDNGVAAELGMIDVNCRVVVELAHVYGGRFVSRGSGGLVLMSSLLAFQGVPRSANYAATKAFVQTFAEGLRLELGPHGVDVLAVAPGPVDSGFAARANMTMGPTAKPDVVPRSALAALGRRGTTRPGPLAKLLEASLAPLPRTLRTQMMGRVMAGMTKRAP
jgi:short-subunit dehydrogenase